MMKFLVFLIVATLYFHGAYTRRDSIVITKTCLGCICYAATGCKDNVTCFGDVCGQFRMTKPYWVGAGRPTVNNESPFSATAYRNCALDTYCSARAVESFMKKHQQDCNGDGEIDCDDHAAMHQLGPNACSNQLPASFRESYQQCKTLLGNVASLWQTLIIAQNSYLYV